MKGSPTVHGGEVHRNGEREFTYRGWEVLHPNAAAGWTYANLGAAARAIKVTRLRLDQQKAARLAMRRIEDAINSTRAERRAPEPDPGGCEV